MSLANSVELASYLHSQTGVPVLLFILKTMALVLLISGRFRRAKILHANALDLAIVDVSWFACHIEDRLYPLAVRVIVILILLIVQVDANVEHPGRKK